jgi:hypothetical protein
MMICSCSLDSGGLLRLSSCNLILGSAFVVCATAKHELGTVRGEMGKFPPSQTFSQSCRNVSKIFGKFSKRTKSGGKSKGTQRDRPSTWWVIDFHLSWD